MVANSEGMLRGTKEPRATLPAPMTGQLWPGILPQVRAQGLRAREGERLSLSGDLPLAVSVGLKAGIRLQGSPRLHETSGNHGRKADPNPEAMEEMRS